jgi:hypothetical protein
MNIYYVTVKMYGTVYVPPVVVEAPVVVEEVEVIPPFEPNQINFTITSFNANSTGTMNFTDYVNI